MSRNTHFAQRCIIGVDYSNEVSGVDSNTESLMSIDYAHHEVHEGNHYFSKSFAPFTGGASQTVDLLIITPDTTTQIHARAAFYANVEFEIYLYEGATVSANGTPVPARNNNRNSSNVALLQQFNGPTVISVGTMIRSTKINTGRNSVGVNPSLNYELILKRNEKYIYRIIKTAVATGYIDLDGYWYEHTPKN